MNNDQNRFVCLIKPVSFEIDGLIYLLQGKGDFEKGYLIESIWKFLIYTEIGSELYRRICQKALYVTTEEEREFKIYIESNSPIFLSDFSTRLQEQVKKLSTMTDKSNAELDQAGFTIRVSEILHDGIIKELKTWLSKIVSEKHQIVILIDNLDKSWKNDGNINILSQYILGLLGVTGRIARELRHIKLLRNRLNFQLTLFLRTDIFKFVMKFAREPDKIEVTRLTWNDWEILFRIIEERYQVLSGNIGSELWEKYFPKEIKGKAIKIYIGEKIFPRPRDLIYIIKKCKDFAVSRGHDKILDNDVESAYMDYSEWAFTAILVENGISISQMEDFMYNLIGESEIITTVRLQEIIVAIDEKFKDSKSFDNFIDHLLALAILGCEVNENEFRFSFDGEDEEKNKILGKKYNSNRYQIHPAFQGYLESNLRK
jgi:hypothetical protein